MKTLTLILMLASVLKAGTLLTTPVLSPDSQSLEPAAPGLGAIVYAIPGSQWLVTFNDNAYNTAPGVNGDFDFNDAWLTIAFTLPGMATLDYVARDSADNNLVRFAGAGASWLNPGQTKSLFLTLSGQAVPVEMLDASLGNTFRTGPVPVNFDNTIHAWVERTDHPAATPEPGTFALLLTGTGGILVGRLRRKRPCR